MTEEAQSEEYGKYGLLRIGENDLLIKKGVIKFPESADDRPCLIGSKCKSCGDVSYPARYFCPKCGSEGEAFHFGAFGEIITHTTVYQGGFGIKTPYAVGMIHFPELNDPELTIVAQIVDCEPDEVYIGMPEEMIIDRTRLTLVGGFMKMMGMPPEYVVGFKYRPIKKEEA
jgi:uncharacterized OB-fold protein